MSDSTVEVSDAPNARTDREHDLLPRPLTVTLTHREHHNEDQQLAPVGANSAHEANDSRPSGTCPRG
jgi:hypothetical protein